MYLEKIFKFFIFKQLMDFMVIDVLQHVIAGLIVVIYALVEFVHVQILQKTAIANITKLVV